jgi:hypothetical protein
VFLNVFSMGSYWDSCSSVCSPWCHIGIRVPECVLDRVILGFVFLNVFSMGSYWDSCSSVCLCTIVCLFETWYLHVSAISRLPDVMVRKTTKGFSVLQCNLWAWVSVWKLISMFVTRLTRRMPLVELFTLPEHMSSPRVLVDFVLLDL